MYIEASRPRTTGDYADLETPPLLSVRRTLLTFMYHMKGSTMGKLQVLVNGRKIWEKSGNQGTAWSSAKISLSQFPDGSVLTFRGICGRSYTGDVAIDSVKFEPAPMPST